MYEEDNDDNHIIDNINSNHNIVIVIDVNIKESEDDENFDYYNHGTISMYTHYRYNSHRTTGL